LVFQSTIFGTFGDFGNFCGPQPDILSHRPHPGVSRLLQTKEEVAFNSLMTALSKPFFLLFPGLFLTDC
jgi:hypothetical protein